MLAADRATAASLPLPVRLAPAAIPVLAAVGAVLAATLGVWAAVLPMAVWLGIVQLDSL